MECVVRNAVEPLFDKVIRKLAILEDRLDNIDQKINKLDKKINTIQEQLPTHITPSIHHP